MQTLQHWDSKFRSGWHAYPATIQAKGRPKSYGVRLNPLSAVFLDDSLELGSFALTADALSTRAPLQVLLSPKDANYAKQEKLLLVELGAIIGRPLYRSDDADSQISIFRRHTARLRYLDRVELRAKGTTSITTLVLPKKVVTLAATDQMPPQNDCDGGTSARQSQENHSNCPWRTRQRSKGHVV